MYRYINILIILAFLFFGCTEDIPDKLDKSQLPAPPTLKIVSTSVKNGQEVNPEHTISVSFNNYMETINMEISGVKGTVEVDKTGASATFKPFSKLADGTYTLTVSGRDEFGQEISPMSITFYVKSSIPIVKSLIAFTSNLDGDYEIYVMNTDGSNIRQLTYNFIQDTQPAWSPDGNFIAFSSDRDGSYVGNSDIFLMDSDGTGVINLTKTVGINEYNAFWSLDGKKIGFLSDAGGFEDYYVMNVNGTGIRLLQDFEFLNFAWPNVFGDYYLYAALNGNSYDIFIDLFANPKGGINLTKHPSNDVYPTWSPDGRKIAFVSDRDLNNEIYIMNSDGSSQTRITFSNADDNHPCWSPF